LTVWGAVGYGLAILQIVPDGLVGPEPVSFGSGPAAAHAREPIGRLGDCSMKTGAYGVFDDVRSGLEHLSG